MAKHESTSEIKLPKMAKTLVEMGTQTDESSVIPMEVHFRYELCRRE